MTSAAIVRVSQTLLPFSQTEIFFVIIMVSTTMKMVVAKRRLEE